MKNFLLQFRGLFKEKNSSYVSLARISYWITFIIAYVFWLRILITDKFVVMPQSLVSILTALLIYNIGKKLKEVQEDNYLSNIGFFKQFRSLFKDADSTNISLGRISFWLLFALISAFWIKVFVTLDAKIKVPDSLTAILVISLIYNMGKKFTPFISGYISKLVPKEVIDGMDKDNKGEK